MVEARGVEPLSENPTKRASPSAVRVLGFPSADSREQDSAYGSFINAGPLQSFIEPVPCLYDAGGLRRRRLRVDGHRIKRRRRNCRYSQLLFFPILGQIGAAARFSSPLSPVETKYAPTMRDCYFWRMLRSISRFASRLAISSRLS